MKFTVCRCHPSVLTTLIFTSIPTVMGFLAGCGAVPGAQAPSNNSLTEDGDPGTLPATVVEENDYGEYAIIANKTYDAENQFLFSVEAKRGVLAEWTWEWDFGDGVVRHGPDQSYSFMEPGSYLIQVTAMDRQGKIAFILTLDINVEELNDPPVADAGADQMVDEGKLVFLYGGASFDPDDGELTYRWAQLSGSPIHLMNAEAVTASFIAPYVDADSSLAFSLTVSDGELTSQDAVTIFVSNLVDIASVGPVADAGADQEVAGGELVTLNGSQSKGSGNEPLSFLWTQITGPTVGLADVTGSVTTFVAPEVAGNPLALGFELLVSEGDLSAFDEVTVVVTPPGSTDDGGTGNDNCPNDPNKTEPGVCGCGVPDADSDGDGSANCIDLCPSDPGKTEAGICGCGTPDTDSDGDGAADCLSGCPSGQDADSDGDGILDCHDGCPDDPNKTAPGMCGCGVADADGDNDGTPDCNDACPDDAGKTEPGICGCGVADQDSDGDGIADCADECPGEPDVDTDSDGTLNCDDGCPFDPAKVSPGLCGCGVSDTDSDGDGVPDCHDECPDGQDTDSDGDGVLDCRDGCPDDPDKTAPGVCGCGTADDDSDFDGIPNCNDQCIGEPDVDSDGDGVLNCDDTCPQDPAKVDPGVCGCGVGDTDSDSDGVANCDDGCPNDAFKTSPGQCGCGVPDDDTDFDGTADCDDQCVYDPGKVYPGFCGCGVADTDSDGDGTPDCGDGCPNDPAKTQPGTCGCGVADVDSDGDGVPDCNDQCLGEPDVDSDGDGTLDCDDGCPGDPGKTAPGVCGCGVTDSDADGDGVLDCNDVCPGFDDNVDTDGNGTPDGCEPPDGGSLIEDFDVYSVGADPANWMDTAADNSLSENNALFSVFQVGGNNALGTGSTAYNIHSHYVGQGGVTGSSFEFTGRMRLSNVTGGLGVTFLSAYPNADVYYRLRRFSGYGGDAFQISPHGTSIAGGTVASGVDPAANTWYRFRIKVSDTGSQTEIRAKVWTDGAGEPASWPIDCYDNSATRMTSGTIGVWSMASGIKYWDDLSVSMLDCDVDSDSDGTVDCIDGCVNDPGKTEPGACGCGIADTDSDSDGVPDCIDQCPGAPDIDSDGDGTADCLEPTALCVSPNSLSFGATTTSLAFAVWNCGGGSLDYAVGGNASWLTVSPSVGDSSGEHDTITVSVDRVGLPDDTYQAEITVNPSVGTAITVMVTMTVGASGALPTPVIVASRTEGTTPLAVFFEGTASQDAQGASIDSAGLLDTELREFVWTFERYLGGTTYADRTTVRGFNAAYVFEPPGSSGPNGEPSAAGSAYRVTLSVTDKDGRTASATQQITAQPFTGTTYYVRADGSDTYSGTGPAAGQAWKTYNKAFVAAAQTLGGGDRVLFKRGDTFSYSSRVVLTGNLNGVLIGAYGTGNPPVIQYTGSITGNSGAPISTNSVSAVSIADLHFRCNSGGVRANGFSVGSSRNVLLLRVTIEDYQSTEAISYPIGVNNTNMMFVVDSTLRNASVTNMFYSGSRLALLNNNIGPAIGSHNFYGSLIDRGVIQGNTFHHPEASRTNVRIAANHATSRNVVVSDNELNGGGTWLSVHLGITSGSWDLTQHCENLLFEGNTIFNAGGLILLNSDYRDTIIRGNTLQGAAAFQIGAGNQIPDDSGYDGPRGLWFYENDITNSGSTWYSNTAPSSIDVRVWNNTVNGNLVPGTAPP